MNALLAITWDFSSGTSEFEQLCIAVAAGIVLAILGGLLAWGLIKGIGPMFRTVDKLLDGTPVGRFADEKLDEWETDEETGVKRKRGAVDRSPY